MEVTPAEKKKSRLGRWLIAVVVTLLVLVSFPIQRPFGISTRSESTKVLAYGKMVVIACRLYAGDHDGNFPADLEALVPKYLPEKKWLYYTSEDKKRQFSWQYFGGKDTDPSDKILLKSDPAWHPSKRIVIRVDQSGGIEKLK